jgi:hypothetical protein
MNPPKVSLANISFLDERPSGVTTGSNIALAARLLITALALILCPIKALSQGSITVTSVTLTPGNEIFFDWTLTGPANTFLEGKVLYYLNSLPLNDANAAAQATVHNKPASGNSKFMPVPGCNFITVSLFKQPTTGPAKPPIPTTLPIPGPGQPTPRQPGPVPPVPVENPILASVTSKCIYVSAQAASLTGPDGLITAANRKQLLGDYAPLFLYSYDHDHDEKYAPIDVVSYVQDSSLVSQVPGVQGFAKGTLSAASENSPLSILNPPVVQPNAQKNGGLISSSATPVKLYLEPSPAGQNGDWTIVTNKLCSFATALRGCQSQNVGLYARATLVSLDVNLPSIYGGRIASNPSLPIAALRARYGCTYSPLHPVSCLAQVIKLEYWQFYGYSHDYDAEGSIFALLGPQINQLINQDLTDHDGDWCTVQVYVDAGWWQSSAQSHRPDLAILYVSHYFHGNQAGFDMDSVEQAPTSLVVPAPNSGNHGTTYSAQQYQGPHSTNSVDLPVDLDGKLWLTSQGPSTDNAAEKLSDAQNLDYVQNNTLQLALDPLFSASGARIIAPVYKHPVVYVEWGAHEFWPTSGWSIAAASKHNGLGKYSYFGDAPVDVTYLPVFSPQTGAQNLPSPLPSTDVALVNLFAGYWGAPQTHNGPPPGPPLHCEWYWDPSWEPATLGTPPTNLLDNLEAGQEAPTTPQPGQLPTSSDSQGTCGGSRPF